MTNPHPVVNAAAMAALRDLARTIEAFGRRDDGKPIEHVTWAPHDLLATFTVRELPEGVRDD